MSDDASYYAREGSALLTRRLPAFAIGWIGTLVIWLAVFAVEGRLNPAAVVAVVVQVAVLGVLLLITRSRPHALRVVPVTVAASVLLGLASMQLAPAVGAYGEILAFMLLTLYLAAALLFSWGWRAELALLVLTLGPWALQGVRSPFFIPPAELLAAIAIGALVAVAIAEGAARNTRAVLRRRRAQERATTALQASHDAYRDLAETARHLIWVADREGRLTYVNEALASFLGVPVHEAIGRRIGEFHTAHPDNPDFPTTLAWALSGEVLPPVLVECATPRGPRWVEGMTSLILDEQGRVVGLSGISRDVQERHEAEMALRASEERFRSAFDHAAIGVVVVAMDGKPLQVNKAFCEMLGYEPAELVGRTMDTFAHPDDVTHAATETMRLLLGEIRAFQMEKRYLHKNGHAVWCLLGCSLTRDALGEPLHLIAQIQDISERKAAEDALRASEARYRSLVESQREWVVRTDMQGRVTFVTDAYARTLGTTREAVLGRTGFHFVHPDDLALVMEAFRQLEHPPHRVTVECRTLTSQGERWVSWEGGAVLDEHGHPVELQSVGRDVTERHAAEDALRASEGRYRGLVESQQELIVRLSVDGRFTFVNDAYAAKFGKSQEALMGQPFLHLVHPDDRDRSVETMAAMARPPHRVLVEIRNLTAEGVRWIAWEGGVVVDADGRMVEAQAVGRDVTERRASEDALRASETRFRSAFDDAAIGMAVTTIDGRTLRVNPALCDMLGYAEHELLACTTDDIVHPDDRGPLEIDRGGLAEGRARFYRAERRYLRSDGRIVWVYVTASMVRDANGEPLYFIGQIQDITERRLAEEALKGSLLELRRSEEKLRLLARRQVAIREEERKRLGFDLHDDVCQELVGVGILVESLRRKLSPMSAEHSAEFERVVGYLGEVVEHLRLLARELRPLLLRDLGLDGSLRSLADGMSSPSLRVVPAFAETIPRLEEEAEVIVYRIAQEALANAVRHAGAHRIVIGLEAGAGELHLEVRDDGHGFDPSARPAVALGLASMEERALALGGRLEIRSHPDQGTTVALVCPLALRIPGRFRELAAPSPTRSSSPPSGATTPRAAARD